MNRTPNSAAIAAAFSEALEHHGAGRLEQAERLYRRVLARDSAHADSRHLLGLIACQSGRPEAGIGMMEESIRLRGEVPAYHYNLATALYNCGRLDASQRHYARALALNPDYVEAHCGLGKLLCQRGRFEEAAGCYERALAIRPESIDALCDLAGLRKGQGRYAEAARFYERALAIKGDDAALHNDLGLARKEEGRLEEAAAHLRRAIALQPDLADCHSNLGNVLQDQRKLDEAVACYRQAVALDPALADGHNNLGLALQALGKIDEALVSFERALALNPEDAQTHTNFGMCLLLAGELRRGFREYRWRRNLASSQINLPQLPGSSWEGESLDGKSLLVHCEQGYGDSLHFIRYVVPLSRLAERVSVRAPGPLARLFRSIPGVDILGNDPPDPTDYDFHVPLICLPRLFDTTLATIPAEIPYLSADPAQVMRWAGRLSAYPQALRVGLCWAGESRKHNRRAHLTDRRRSLALDAFAGLAGIPDIAWFSLQKGEPAEQARHQAAGLRLVDVTAEFHDFADTAALVANLDLVISVDTAVAHLAGALGKPVWLLSRFDGCWRWLLHREDTPWYPKMRIFRQPRESDWGEVIERMRGELTRLDPTSLAAPGQRATR